MSVPFLEIKENETLEIVSLLDKLKQNTINFKSCYIHNELFSILHDTISKTTIYSKLLHQAQDSLYSNKDGFLLIDFGNNFMFNEKTRKVLTIFLSGVLYPFGIFDKYGLWKEIGVDLTKETNRSSGVGYNPFHIDFVNTATPPPYSILFCMREDPNGGGETIISNFLNVLKLFPPKELKYLSEDVFEEGMFFGLNNVGKERNPFPVIETNLQREVIIRFTAKMKSKTKYFYLIKKIEEELIKNQKTFLLKKNQLLIMNQRVVCHGRLSLKGKQEELNPNNRRLLIQTFGKNYEPII